MGSPGIRSSSGIGSGKGGPGAMPPPVQPMMGHTTGMPLPTQPQPQAPVMRPPVYPQMPSHSTGMPLPQQPMNVQQRPPVMPTRQGVMASVLQNMGRVPR